MLTWWLVGALVACAQAITRDQFYPHGAGLDQRLPKGSDIRSPETTLKVPIVFYGETYETIFVNNYGVLSFRADIPEFLNTEFPLPYPSIAAFYTNVDTSDAGTVYYRETDESHVLLKAEESVQNNFHEYFDFKPTSVFISTWLEVSYTGTTRPDRSNTFQVAVISNGTESFVEFLYPEREIQWIQKESNANSLPDAKAQAGFIAEDGRLYLLRGSGSHQIRNIVSWSNTHEPGRYVFRVGNIPQDGNIAVPDQYNQNEVEIEEESKTCAQSGPSVCHIQARCVDYQAGICCQCIEGFYGNGKSCIKDDVPLRVHGKLNGLLNEEQLNDVDVQSYVVVADGRSYTALSQGPPQVGSSLQLLNVIGGVVGWMFAKPQGTAKNGYQLTGALFNHSADIFFPATGDRVTVNQEFLGHDVFDQITLESDVRGTVPHILPGVKLDITEYEEQYTLVELGLVRSESTRVFTNKVTGEKYEQRISQSITFNSCRYAPPSEEDSIPSTLKVAKSYLGYEVRENIVRYGMSNKIIPLGQEDPCIKGRSSCGTNSACVVKGDSFTCVCSAGFSNIYQNNAAACIDIDECAAGTHNCDSNADCYNHDGGFQCRCRPGFEGNGISCTRVFLCRDKQCDSNAQCIDNYGEEPLCICNPGYTGDGQRCWQTNAYTCDVSHNCSPYGSCTISENGYVCRCNPGYTGDGYYCTEEQQPQQPQEPQRPDYTPYPSQPSYPSYTSPQPQYPEQTDYNPYTQQQPQYPQQNGYTPQLQYPQQNSFTPQPQQPQQPDYNTPYTPPQYQVQTTPNPSTELEYNETFVLPNCDDYGCGCPSGYSSYRDERNNDLCRLDSFGVTTPETNDTYIRCSSKNDCPPNAICSFDTNERSYEPNVGHCVCPEGYEGDAFECIERTGPSCVGCAPNAHCVDVANGDFLCVCDSGYHGDGYVCRPNFSCTNNSDCEFNAECRPDPTNYEYVCQCIDGFIKDENDACILDGQLCNGALCAEHATCLFDYTLEVYYCHCEPGYEGDGISECLEVGATCDVANNCDPNAECQSTEISYHCVCRDGFTGDGYACTPEQSCRNDPYMCHVHAACIKRNGAYVCECNSGYNGNGTQCELNPRQSGNFLVASDGMIVYRVPFQVSARDVATPINSAYDQIAVGIDVDCQTGRIYWGDVVSSTIKSAGYDGSGYEIFLLNNVKSPEGIAVDWSARNVFWTDSKKLTIEVANLDTKVRKVLFAIDGISNPRGIAVHPQRGKIFWSDWNRAGPKIEWANMDGSQRGIFLDSGDVKLPNSLAIDWSRDRLCYADAGLNSIKCVGIDTLERETIAANCSYPFGLTINGDKFYWTDWKTLKIEYIDTLTQIKGHVPIATASKRLYGVSVAPDQCSGGQNVCQYRNGNCQHDQLCLPDGRGSRICVAGEQAYGY